MRIRSLVFVSLLFGLAACNQVNSSTLKPPPQQEAQTGTVSPSQASLPSAEVTATPSSNPPRLLSICLINEPRSLFLYDAVSNSERSVLEAIYDGPIDIKNFTPTPVILAKMPSMADGDALLQSISVNAGDLIVDAQGNLTNLEKGVIYRPSGCTELACAQTYSGADPVQMDQLAIQFKLLPDLQWSDGMPLTAADSVYSFEVARKLTPAALPDLVGRTSSYKALDDLTMEWTGVPGFMEGQFQTKFFTPLPQHAWAVIPVNELSRNEASSRKPVGWGPYILDEWVPGDHITLHSNPLYFRASEGLPHFDDLVYRFVADNRESLSAVSAGECDVVDQSAGTEAQTAELLQLRDSGSISLIFQTAYAWDLLEFDVSPLNPDHPPFFASKEARLAVAMCINRQALVKKLSSGPMQVADLYIPSDHPLYDTAAKQYTFKPQAASDLLTATGWLDTDNDPSTPRVAQGVNGIADGTSFTIQFLTSDDTEHQAVAEMVQADLKQCGVQLNIDPQPVQQLLAAGPDGPVFGRQFDLAQFAWMTAVEPPCSLFLTNEIPGPYPDYAKGWGGVNPSGYSNPLYDQSCLDALFSLPATSQHQQKHFEAQVIFAEDLPALPLYWHYHVIVGRPDLCGLPQQTVAESIFSDLELIDYGNDCP